MAAERVTGAAGVRTEPPGVDAATFRDVMATVPTGVAILTAAGDDGTPYGMTVGSFCSVSLEPPLVMVGVAHSANCYPVLARCTAFAVSVLRPGQVGIARRFAGKSADKFGAGGLRPGPSGLPVVEDALAVVGCRVHDRHPAGDHLIVVGEVVDAWARTGSPLLYVGRTFAEVAT